MVKTAVIGVAGRMGSRVVVAVKEDPGMELTGALVRTGHGFIGADAGLMAGCGSLGVTITDDLDSALKGADVLIDFTTSAASLKHLEMCSGNGKAMVIGPTGFTPTDMALLKELAWNVPVVQTPNMSVGINVVFSLLADVSKILRDDFDVEITETHHRMKKDSPSGTAMKMGEIVSRALGRNFDKVANFHRQGMCGERSGEEIGMHSVRGGDIVGEHSVYFIGMGERIEITHRAHTRDMFARGAVRAAKWVVGKKPGLYDMQHVLGLK